MTVDLQMLAILASLLMALGSVVGVVAGYKVALHRITVLERRVDRNSQWREAHVEGHGEATRKVTEEMGQIRQQISELNGNVNLLIELLRPNVEGLRRPG